jgi:hypothetical protein
MPQATRRPGLGRERSAKRSPGGRSVRNRAAGAPVFIELSSDQLSQVVRAVSGGGHVSVLLSGLDNARAPLEAGLDYSRLSGSLLRGLSILVCLPVDGRYLSLTELASQTGMTLSTTHRYLSTLLAVGLIERTPDTREYRLAR